MAASPLPSPVPTVDITVPWPQVERFVGLFTHDIRNGLNAVELQLTLLGEISDDPSVKEEVRRVRASVGDITRQLHAVRLATGPLTPHLFLYPAVDFVEDLRERFERRYPDATARTRWQVELGRCSLSIDPELSMTALLELLGNALLFALDGSLIEVRAEDGADGMMFAIRQSCGAAPVDAPDNWGRTPLTSSRRDGYGLGAFRAWRTIEAQKGTLRFTFLEGEQSMVTTVVLPVAAPDK